MSSNEMPRIYLNDAVTKGDLSGCTLVLPEKELTPHISLLESHDLEKLVRWAFCHGYGRGSISLTTTCDRYDVEMELGFKNTDEFLQEWLDQTSGGLAAATAYHLWEDVLTQLKMEFGDPRLISTLSGGTLPRLATEVSETQGVKMSEYSKHAFQLLTDPYDDEVEIDIEIVPLIRALWALGLETMNCCQDNHGYIWIEFPPDHAQVFMNAVRDNCDEDLRWRISRAIPEDPRVARKYFESINDLPDTWLVSVCTNCPALLSG
jgi:hypothetical protein